MTAPGTSHDALETIVHRPLDRGNALYFSGYVHGVHVCRVGSRVFVKSKCWATQKKICEVYPAARSSK